MKHLCPPPRFCIEAPPELQRVYLASDAAIACHYKASDAIESGHWAMAWAWMERAANYIRIGRTIARHDWGGGSPPGLGEVAAQRRRQSTAETMA